MGKLELGQILSVLSISFPLSMYLSLSLSSYLSSPLSLSHHSFVNVHSINFHDSLVSQGFSKFIRISFISLINSIRVQVNAVATDSVLVQHLRLNLHLVSILRIVELSDLLIGRRS